MLCKARLQTFATGPKEIVKLALVAGKQSSDLLLLGQDLLILDAQPGGTLCCHSQFVTFLCHYTVNVTHLKTHNTTCECLLLLAIHTI